MSCQPYIEISAGESHALILSQNGRVGGFGDNFYGQMNIPTNIQDNVSKIFAADLHSLAILKDGRVTGWGRNNFGQINIPVGIGNNATGIAGGESHSFALLKNGSITGWGSNQFNQINFPSQTSNIVQIGAGEYNSFALFNNGRLSGWGDGGNGALNIPTDIQGNIANLWEGSSRNNFFVILKDGRVTGWGTNPLGELNAPSILQYNTNKIAISLHGNLALLKDGTVTGWGLVTDNRFNIPTNIQGNVTGIALGILNSLAILKNGTVTGTNNIGLNNFGLTSIKCFQNITFLSIPIKFTTDPSFNLNVTSTNNTIPITYSSSNTNVATVSSNGTVSIVGVGTTTITANQAGDSNYNAAPSVSRVLYVSPGCYNYSQIAAGFYHSLALLKDGTVTGWGSNGHGEINIPAGIGTNATGIAAGQIHSLALLKDGRVTGWGNNQFGQTTIPVGIGNNATGIAAGGYFSLALLKDGTVTGWGMNDHGEINIPAGIGNNATGIAAGFYHSLALLKDGRVTGWGRNSSQQLNIPLSIQGNVTGISAGNSHSLALLKDGRVTGWGGNSYDEINIPIGIGTNAAAVTAAEFSSFALLKDGGVTGWGWNAYGQTNIPVGIGNNVTAISAGGAHSLALLKDGSIVGWGRNNDGQINIPKCSQTITFPSIPTKTFGDPSFNLNVTSANNTIPITYSSSNTNVATVSSNGTVSIVGAGNATITASQAGDSNYNAATPVSQTLTVNKSNQTITFPSISTKTFGDPSFNPGATASSNLPVTYTSSNTSIATVVGSLVNIIGAGSVTITANQAGNSNYNAATPISQTFTVNKGNQTINFQQINQKVLGDPPFNLSATSSSNSPIIFTSSNGSIISIQNNTATISNPGLVTITASQNGNENYNSTSTSQTIYVKNKTIINFPNISTKLNGDPPFDLNVTSNNPSTIYYTSSNTSIATVDSNGNVTILQAGTVNITASQFDDTQYVGESVTKNLQIEFRDINTIVEVFQPSPYVNYAGKNYKRNFNNEVYGIGMPQINEPHILLLDLNLYGFDEDKMEDCDIEMNAAILKTGFFKDVIKNPSLLNLEIKDLTYSTGIISNISDYLKEKLILKDIKANNFINYDTSYYNNATIYSDTRYRFIKNKFLIRKPTASRTKNIPLPVFFKYKSPTINSFYDLGEYNFQIYQGEDKDRKYIRNLNYITGEEFGFLSYLAPGEYTAILSGKEQDFLLSTGSIYSKHQNISTTSLSLELITGEKFQEVYLETPDEIWASYYLDYAELVPGSGFNTLNDQLPIAFNIDFERDLSGIVGIPSLSYKEYTGDFFNYCTATQRTSESDPICTNALKFVCSVAATYEKSGILEMDVPRKNFPKSKYGVEGRSLLGETSNLSSYVVDLIENAVSGNNGSLITYLQDPADQNYHTIAIDTALKALCCDCKAAKKWEDPIKEVQTQIYSGIQAFESGDAIYRNVFFLDTSSPKTLDLKYNSTYYSGQIIFKDFYEGDKISFKQYPFDFDLVYKSLYSVSPSLTRKEYTIDFIYSENLTGNNYFSGKQDLIDKININLANKSYYSWMPFKYNPRIEFDYGPLLTGIDMGLNNDGEEVIGLLALKSGKLGSYSMRLNLESRLQIYNYLVPKIIKLQVSDDGQNWTDIVSSENRQPINTYLKYPTAQVPYPIVQTNIKYDELPNTKYKYEKTVPISSEITSQNANSEDVENLASLASGIASKSPLVSGNNVSGISPNTKTQTLCIPNPTGSGIVCGKGFIDFNLTSTSEQGGFNCSEKEEKEPCPVWPGVIKSGQKIEESLVIDYDEDAKASPYFGYSGNCCTGKYDILTRPTGWCCSGTYISGINERGCKPPNKEKENNGESKDQQFITITQEMNAFRLGFYDYNS